MRNAFLAIIVLCGAPVTPAYAQGDNFSRFVDVAYSYDIISDITYLRASNYEVKLDIYQPRGLQAPNPTVIFFHGGGFANRGQIGWPGGNSLMFLPFFDMGWTIVNADYRTSREAPAPAGVEDGRCLLRWVNSNAKQYNFDVTRIVSAGQSAGGLIGLTTAMIPASAGLDRICPAPGLAPPPDTLTVAAAISFSGVADIVSLLEDPDARTFAIQWIGSTLNRDELAKRVSPLTYVRRDLPPILSVHGDKDVVVPYSQMVRLHDMLEKAGAPHELATIKGGGHGGYDAAQGRFIFSAVRDFLTKYKLLGNASIN